MDWIDDVWPDDLSQVQWGPVSAWAGSILTAGSLLLGFLILFRDRRTEERLQARKLVCHARNKQETHEGAFPVLEVEIFNNSDQLIRDPSVQIIGEFVSRGVGTFVGEPQRSSMHGPRPQKSHVLGTRRSKFPGRPPSDDEYDWDKEIAELEPGKRAFVRADLPVNHNLFLVVVHFRDAEAREWSYDVLSSKLKRFRR